MGGTDDGRLGVWRRAVGSTLGVLVCLIVGQSAIAQVAPTPGGAGGVGSPAENGLALTGSTEVLYDSNVLRTPAASLLTTTAHRDDFRYSPSVSATYGRSTGRISLAANGLVGHDFFQYNSYLSRNRYLGGGALTYHSGSTCQLAVTGTYASRQNGIRDGGGVATDASTTPADDVSTVVDNIQTVSTYGSNFGCGTPSGRLSFGGSYVHSALGNAAATRRFADSNSDVYSGNLGIGILRPGQLGLTGSYTTISYPDRVAGVPGVVVPPQLLLSTAVRTYRLGVSFSRPIGTRLSGSIGASYLHADPTGGQAPYSSPAYNIGLTYTASGRLGFTLNGSRDIIASTTSGAQFRVVDQIILTSRYELGHAISIDANAGFLRNAYQQSFSVAGEPARRRDTTETVGVNVTYTPRKLYDISINLTHTIRNSDPSIFSYTSTKAGLTVDIHI